MKSIITRRSKSSNSPRRDSVVTDSFVPSTVVLEKLRKMTEEFNFHTVWYWVGVVDFVYFCRITYELRTKRHRKQRCSQFLSVSVSFDRLGCFRLVSKFVDDIVGRPTDGHTYSFIHSEFTYIRNVCILLGFSSLVQGVVKISNHDNVVNGRGWLFLFL